MASPRKTKLNESIARYPSKKALPVLPDAPPISVWACLCGRRHDPLFGRPVASRDPCRHRRRFFLLESGRFDEPAITADWHSLSGLRLD